MRRTITLTALPNAAGFAREFTRTCLRSLPFRETADNAELIVSELVGNTVEAAGLTMATPISEVTRRHLVTLGLGIRETVLCIQVWDAQDGYPIRRGVNDEAESGRGLFLVEALSQRWGCTPYPQGGKTVWCVLPLRARQRPSSPGFPPPASIVRF